MRAMQGQAAASALSGLFALRCSFLQGLYLALEKACLGLSDFFLRCNTAMGY